MLSITDSVYTAFNSHCKRTRANCFHRIIEDQGNSADSLSRLRALTIPLARLPSSTYVFVILNGSGLYDATWQLSFWMPRIKVEHFEQTLCIICNIIEQQPFAIDK